MYWQDEACDAGDGDSYRLTHVSDVIGLGVYLRLPSYVLKIEERRWNLPGRDLAPVALVWLVN